jgi:WD40 repeat protein
MMASGDDGGNIKIWDLSSKELIFDYKLHSSGVSSLAFTSDDQLLVSSGWDRNVNVMASSMSMLFSLNKAHNYQKEGLLVKPVIESSPIKSVVEPESFRFEQESLTISFQDLQISGDDLRKYLKKCGQEYASRRKEERSKERVRMRNVSLEIQKTREERLQREQTQREQREKERKEQVARERSVREQEEARQKLREQEEKDLKEKAYQDRKEQAVRERLAREQEEARQEQKKKAEESKKKAEKGFWDELFSSDGRSYSSSNDGAYVKDYQKKDGTKVKGYNRKKK